MKVRNSVQMLGLAFVVLLGLTLLAACGTTPDAIQTNNDFTVPVYTGAQEYPTLENDATFKSKVLVQDANTPPSELKVYATSASLTDVKKFYTDQMNPKLGWNDRSNAITDPQALGSDAWVLGFEKNSNANPPVTHVAGLYMFTPNSAALKDFKNLLPPNNQNVLMIITGTNK